MTNSDDGAWTVDSFAAWPDTQLRFDRSGGSPTMVFAQNGAELVCPRLD